jgi:ubiquinone/menaquinone biosynthesis C-methylase UbiE
MLKSIILIILKLSPSSKKWFWEKWYNIFASKARNNKLKLMNYGYHSSSLKLKLLDEDKIERYPIQLYSFVANQADIKDKNILEVGSGRGGGASFIARYLNPLSITGIDISKNAIDLCSKIYSIPSLNFVVGDSENIPFFDNLYDILINVESSHCYGDMAKFLDESYRVLKPGGLFLFCDFRTKGSIQELYDQFSSSDLKLINKIDITDNIINGLDNLSSYREKHIDDSVPLFFRKIFKTYAGIKGTEIYNAFSNGSMTYICAILKK